MTTKKPLRAKKKASNAYASRKKVARNLTRLMQDEQLREINEGPGTVWGTGVAAAYLGVDVETLRRWRRDGKGPPYIQISSNKCGYRKADMDAFIASRFRQSTSDAGPVEGAP